MSSQPSNMWPDGEDGHVLRGLEEKGFDFSKSYVVDFVVDFQTWPPAQEALDDIRKSFSDTTEYVDEVSGNGSLTVRVEAVLTYQLVIDTQRQLTDAAEKFGGWCDSWGVLH